MSKHLLSDDERLDLIVRLLLHCAPRAFPQLPGSVRATCETALGKLLQEHSARRARAGLRALPRGITLALADERLETAGEP